MTPLLCFSPTIPLQAAGIRVQPAEVAAREAIAALRRAGAKVVVGLFHVGSPAASRRLVTGLTGLDWAVLGHSALNLETPEKAGEARLLLTGHALWRLRTRLASRA